MKILGYLLILAALAMSIFSLYGLPYWTWLIVLVLGHTGNKILLDRARVPWKTVLAVDVGILAAFILVAVTKLGGTSLTVR